MYSQRATRSCSPSDRDSTTSACVLEPVRGFSVSGCVADRARRQDRLRRLLHPRKRKPLSRPSRARGTDAGGHRAGAARPAGRVSGHLHQHRQPRRPRSRPRAEGAFRAAAVGVGGDRLPGELPRPLHRAHRTATATVHKTGSDGHPRWRAQFGRAGVVRPGGPAWGSTSSTTTATVPGGSTATVASWTAFDLHAAWSRGRNEPVLGVSNVADRPPPRRDTSVGTTRRCTTPWAASGR